MNIKFQLNIYARKSHENRNQLIKICKFKFRKEIINEQTLFKLKLDFFSNFMSSENILTANINFPTISSSKIMILTAVLTQ